MKRRVKKEEKKKHAGGISEGVWLQGIATVTPLFRYTKRKEQGKPKKNQKREELREKGGMNERGKKKKRGGKTEKRKKYYRTKNTYKKICINNYPYENTNKVARKYFLYLQTAWLSVSLGIGAHALSLFDGVLSPSLNFPDP